MAVSIILKGNKDTAEYKACETLKSYFEESLKKSPQTKGNIWIISNVTLFGCEVKDIDIIVIGDFHYPFYRARLKTKLKNKQTITKESTLKELEIRSFCFTIELKDHPAERIKLSGQNLIVTYTENGQKKLHDATTQSEKQKITLMSFFNDRLNASPFICNFIWLRQVQGEDIKQVMNSINPDDWKTNFLPSKFTLNYLLQLSLIQNIPFSHTIENDKQTVKSDAFYFIRENKKTTDYVELFTQEKPFMSSLSRSKVEKITSKILKGQNYARDIGHKLVIISGKAGTGKTIKLLNIAADLALRQGARCLILTYNLALVGDIKRTLALADISDKPDRNCVDIKTIHKFFRELTKGFGILRPDKFITEYKEHLAELSDYLTKGVINEEDIYALIKSNHDEVGWDYLLIDESQDCLELEKDILYRIFGMNKIIIADGYDQLIRSKVHCNWTRGLKSGSDFAKTFEKRSVRQKENILNFIAAYSKIQNKKWDIESDNELTGGRVIISARDFNKDIYDKEYQHCLKSENSAYEMLFLVPPSLVHKDKDQEHPFLRTDSFRKMGINFWDGTSNDTRRKTLYPADINQHRVLQYDSCRGLEGWTVVCLELDSFYEYKRNSFRDEYQNTQLTLDSFEERQSDFSFFWTLIPMTRAIDTLIITLKDKNSDIGRMLYEIAKENPDYIDYIE